MSKKFEKLTRPAMRDLPPGKRIVEHGIIYEKTKSGDGRFEFCSKPCSKPPKQIRHTLQHTAITHLVQAGVDLPTVKRISGHKTLQMIERYSHQNNEHIQQALSKLDGRYLGRM